MYELFDGIRSRINKQQDLTTQRNGLHGQMRDVEGVHKRLSAQRQRRGALPHLESQFDGRKC
jgi:hypothetical protein